jgi:uncharacterized protein (DUF427 family)
MTQLLWSALNDLRVHPIEKWVRASYGDVTIVDTRRAQLVWEPRRVVGSYAVPEGDIAGDLVPAAEAAAVERPVSVGDLTGVLDPSSPFTAHSAAGASLTIRTSRGDLVDAAFRPDDPDLAGYVVLDWSAFTQWSEEDEPVVAHPRDPFHRIDCLRSSRHVRIGLDGVTLADTTRATWLFETSLPVRFYVPAEDIVMDKLETTVTHTQCAYKGQASYWSARVGTTVLPDIAWSYPDPLDDALPVRGLIAFLTERLDLVVDGQAKARPRTPWS